MTTTDCDLEEELLLAACEELASAAWEFIKSSKDVTPELLSVIISDEKSFEELSLEKALESNWKSLKLLS